MWQVICLIAIGTPVINALCWPGSTDPWGKWTDCTASCGGGTRKRDQYVCWYSNNHQTEDCNEFCNNGGTYLLSKCYCPRWRHGRCCDQCKKDYYIANCEPNSASCGGSPDNVKCTKCSDPYYSGGYGGGCKLCSHITNCKNRNCTNSGNSKCSECVDNNVFFKRTHADTKCERLCAWNNHYCWPGSCSRDNLVKNCKCPEGFQKVHVKDRETSCQLSSTNKPTIKTCETWVRGPRGEMKQANTTNATRECENMADFYGNFQPRLVTFHMSADFSVNNSYFGTRPDFISEEYTFGITDVSAHVDILSVLVCHKQYVGETKLPVSHRINLHRSDWRTKKFRRSPVAEHFCLDQHSFDDIKLCIIESNHKWSDKERKGRETYWIRRLNTLQSYGINKGSEKKIDTSVIRQDDGTGTNAMSYVSGKANITIPKVTTLEDGEWLCMHYEAKAGGYLKSFDLREKTRRLSPPVPYRKTVAINKLCYRFDISPPAHCASTKSCSSNPLQLSERITRSPIIQVEFNGWFDPLPKHGNKLHASDIESYSISVHGVDSSSGLVKITTKEVIPTKTVHKNITSLTLNLTFDTPKLLSISLDVKDVADNVRHARQFVLIDNSSFIEVRNSNEFYVDSATTKTKHTWQTHHNEICLSWKDYFYNKYYLDNPILNPIEPDSSQYNGVYEQHDSPLSISGTPNIHGITGFLFTWKRNEDNVSSEITVPKFEKQYYCHKLPVKDGETYTLTIQAADIVNNTYTENRTVHIDRSVPYINNLGLMKNGEKQLFVHNQINLSKMDLYFESLDPHSGISTIEWAFGTSDGGQELIVGLTSPRFIKNFTCPKSEPKCYCPNVGACEIYAYTISLNALVKNNTEQGNHNRNYYFSVKATNKALLTNVEHLDILVDDSPPVPGVVFEGPLDGYDIDYTSDESFPIHWHGFIDHESGIRLYKVGIANRCLSSTEMANDSISRLLPAYIEVPFPELSAIVSVNFTSSKYFTTVAAINNALAISATVCSDGITRDTSLPQIRNVTLQHAKWADTLLCNGEEALLVQSNLKTMRINQTTSCIDRCMNSSTSYKSIVDILPAETKRKLDKDTSEFLCLSLPSYDSDVVTYLPHDQIYLHWDVDAGQSQIEDYQVGIANDASEIVTPGIIDYMSSNKRQQFHFRHVGVASSQLFYILIKAISKAGLTSVESIGPILIDETPPDIKYIPFVNISETDVIVAWSTDTFYDLDQKENINQVYFEIGVNGKPIIPLMEWRLDTSVKCLNTHEFCIKYPLRKLQKHDTDMGLDFYFTMYVYNNAGHFTQLDTEKFKIPSKYPPGSAVIFDIDPKRLDESEDVDIHFTTSTMCARWKGYRHHEQIMFEIAVGTDCIQDNILSYRKVGNATHFCVNSTLITTNVHLYFLVRATCTGGQTISSSDGVVIVTQAYINKNLKVHVGDNCTKLKPVISRYIQSFDPESTLFNESSLNIGASYIINVSVNATISVDKDQGILEPVVTSQDGSTYSFVPVFERPLFYFQNNNKSVYLSIVECKSGIQYQSKEHDIKSFWSYDNGKVFPTEYEITLKQNSIHNVSKLQNGTYKTRTETLTQMIKSSYTEAGTSYHIDVSPCIKNQCLKPISSERFTITKQLNGRINVAEIAFNVGSSCFNATMEWPAFTSTCPMMFYQWSVSEEATSKQILTNWKTIYDDGELIKVNECIQFPSNLHKTMFGCVRGFAEDGQSYSICKEIEVTSPGEYNHDTIYDVDITKGNWPIIKDAITSSNIGGLYKTLHDSELDFGNKQSKIGGVILYGTERQIDWFLMKVPNIPYSCDISLGCIFSVSSNTGFVDFTNAAMKPNILYFICALSNATYVERELFTETLGEVRSCSDGFIIDDTPPTAGRVFVTNTNGYLTDMSRITITWNHFFDDIDASLLGYIESIKSYSYGIGKRPGGDDIVKFTDVGLSRVSTATMTNCYVGEEVFISVKATDHVGLTTVATSSALTIDTSPPVLGTLQINRFLSSATFIVWPLDFHDDESGIDFFELSVGSSPTLGDIISAIRTSNNQYELKLPVDLHDGHEYYVNVRAINRAGLTSNYVTDVFIVDRSVPTGGHILDGQPFSKKDQDFQEDAHHISAHWKGFDDIHSGIRSYRVGLGSEPYIDDVDPMLDVGVNTEIMWNSSFVPGQRYYTTVEACNNVGLCITRCSNGIVLDNSPPLKGLVKVGTRSHQKYIPKSSSVHLEWYGFEDPQSDIDHFEACIGTAPDQCDILPYFQCLLHSSIMKSGLKLPTNQNMYATVKVYNKVGMYVSQSSDTFCVDESPPVVISPPKFVFDSKSTEYSIHWEPSILKITWQFEDGESPILRHTIALKTHHDGHTPVELLKLGSETNTTIILDENSWLKSGDRYYVIVTCCNAAGHCVFSQSNDVLIDSTPPHTGGFKPPMKWKTENNSILSEVFLTWYGFHDQESGIDKYYITVSRSYSGDELSNGVIGVKSNQSDVQEISVKLEDMINRNEKIILSIWAQNKAGMNSSIARVSVDALSTSSGLFIMEGVLQLEKHSCQTHYCNNDCTCAVVGKPCKMVNNLHSCTDIDSVVLKNITYPLVNVYGGLRHFRNDNTASSACLTGYWNLKEGDLNVSRFEWSMGLYNQPVGEGIFDLTTEIPWNDVGLRMDIIHCLPTNYSILHTMKYLVYVKVWYSPELSRVFKSDPIKIDQSPPHVRDGKRIKDSDANCNSDFDFIDWMNTITACWDQVFSEQQSELAYYSVSLGTSPKADDVYHRTNVNLNTSLTLTNLSLSHGTKYYFNVIAHNSLGLHTSSSSDGFVVDMDKPVAGVVFNTERHKNKAFQSSNEGISLSWHGFIDHHSGIKSYFVAILEENKLGLTSPTFTNVGLRNSYTFRAEHLEHGKRYVGIVKAVDAGGHESHLSTSPAVTVDNTPPHGLACKKYHEIIYENITCATDRTYIFEKGVNFVKNNLIKVTGYFRKIDTRTSALLKIDRFAVKLSMFDRFDDSSTFKYVYLSTQSVNTSIQLSGLCMANSTVSIIVSSCSNSYNVEDDLFELHQLHESEVSLEAAIIDNESYVRKVYVGLGTTLGGYQIQPLMQVHISNFAVFTVDVNQGTPIYATLIAENYAGLRSIFHSQPLIIDKTPPVFSKLPFVRSEAKNDTFAFNVRWDVGDDESGLQLCLCALGNKKDDTGILDFVPADTDQTCTFENVIVEHGDVMYAHVLCVNGRELVSKSTSDPVHILLNPPFTGKSSVDIIPTNADFSDISLRSQKNVQSNASYLQLQWSGFYDIYGIEHYEYCLKHGSLSVIDWASVGKQTMTAISGKLQSGSKYTAEVRAWNAGHHVSEAVSCDILVLGSAPELTGKSLQMNIVGDEMMLDWSMVFYTMHDVSYTLTIGTKPGYDDITNSFYTDSTSYKFAIPTSTLLNQKVTQIFFDLTCSYSTGMSSQYKTSYKLG